MSLITSVFQEENVITDNDIALYVEIIKEIARLSRDNNSELLITYIDATSEQLANTRWSNETIISELSKLGTIVDVTLAETREELDARFYIHELDKLLKQRVNKINPRRKLTAEESKRLARLEAIAATLRRGENVQNRQLQTWLSDDEYAKKY